MNRAEAAREIKSRYAEYLKPAKVKNTYICPICDNGIGSDGDGISVDPNSDGLHFKCFKCGFYGDIVDFYRKANGCTIGEAFTALYEYFNITIDKNDAEGEKTPSMPIKKQMTSDIKPQEKIENKPDFTDYLKSCYENRNDIKANNYLSSRGISQGTAEAYKLGYDKQTGFIIIPVSKTFYIARNIENHAKLRYQNPKGANIEIFNIKSIYNKENKPVFICEGVFDALSIIEAGGLAISLNSTSNCNKLIEILKENKPVNTLLLCLDSDESGKKAAEQLSEELKALEISYKKVDVTGKYKDPNEAMKSNRQAFFEAVKAAERTVTKPDNTKDYINYLMAGEIRKLENAAMRKTGFSNLDAETGGVYPGLYAVGGISAVGKTTFIYQMADQMATAGQHVLFFSMEQSRLELASKSISRTTALKDVNTAVSSIAIRTGKLTTSVLDAADSYSESVGDRISVIEGNFDCTVSFIGEYTRQYMEKNGVYPVVIIDYLQVLRGEKDPETGRKPSDTKQIVDYNVTQLKRMSRSLDIPIFVISSLNRSNYLTPVDFEAFKESGGIEYTADVVWGLQLDAMNEEIFEKEGKIKEKRQKIKDAKSAMPREIELVCLKNRYGRNYNAYFAYYPQYDLFRPRKPEATSQRPIRKI